jgi:hypothetical protein
MEILEDSSPDRSSSPLMRVYGEHPEQTESQLQSWIEEGALEFMPLNDNEQSFVEAACAYLEKDVDDVFSIDGHQKNLAVAERAACFVKLAYQATTGHANILYEPDKNWEYGDTPAGKADEFVERTGQLLDGSGLRPNELLVRFHREIDSEQSGHALAVGTFALAAAQDGFAKLRDQKILFEADEGIGKLEEMLALEADMPDSGHPQLPPDIR